ncbi:MAG: D-glycero-beta-D-manno-heptose 1,7-bisphosphate 7-phosphatase [Cellvibrionaceae bacterium]|nr:D-glycero-beta-D-manno-heptose 1,7-bisphosphate 7-phosphatase [Cellvibrionaceae bacterium]
MIKVAFLDRDGVINEDVGYTHQIADFRFCQGVQQALRLLQQQGYTLMIVTNQSGIGRGYYTEAQYQKLTQWYCQQLAQVNITISDVFHCPHTPEEQCDCRKPAPGLFHQALQKYAIDLSASLMVGDRQSDMQAAQAAGIERCYLIQQAHHRPAQMTYPRYKNLLDCVLQEVAS